MENLYTNYKNIVDRAILSGIITEESRHFYLSAIDEEDGSELSELETRLNQEEEMNASSNYKQKIGRNDDTKESTTYENENKTEEIENLSLNNEDSQSTLEGTIENYSILDIKIPKNNDFEETDSDSCSIRQGNVDSRSTEKFASTVFAKVMKKPQKYQLLDFNVPIYVDIKRNKPKIKRDSSICPISTKKYSSCNKEKKSSDEVLEKDYKQSLNKIMIRNTKMPSMEKDKSVSLKQCSDLTNSNMSDRTDEHDEKTECLCQKNKHRIKKRSVHTCLKSTGNENSESFKGDLKVLLGDQKRDRVSREKKMCQHCGKGPIINALKPFKFPLNPEHKHKMKLTCPVASNVRQNSYMETFNDNNVNDEENTDKWKQCKCNYICKCTQYASNTNNSESNCEWENLDIDVTTEKKPEEKNRDRILKLNIVCQFYQEEKLKKPNDDQDKNKECAGAEGSDKKEGNNKMASEDFKLGKNKRRMKTQRLSKIFSHIKMKKTQKQSLSHS